MVDLVSSLSQQTDFKDRPSTYTRNQVNNEDDASSTISSQSNLVDSFVAESPPQSHKSANLAGHPCAAGCGHFCWAANRDSEEL